MIIVTPPVTPPGCPAGQHLTEGGQCQADHVCESGQIGGGSEVCEDCPLGTNANEAETECVPNGRYQVAKCTRPVQLPAGAGNLLPHHANAAVYATWDNSFKELGFFADNWNEVIAKAALAKGLVIPSPVPWGPPIVIPPQIVLSGGSVGPDSADSATCRWEYVTRERYETVKDRMDTYDWTDRYHLTETEAGVVGYGNCIDWADNVLAP